MNVESLIQKCVDEGDPIIDLSSQGLTSVPKILSTATRVAKVNLSKNKIKKLENLPPDLMDLDVSDNELESFGDIPKSVTIIDASNNYLSDLDGVPLDIIELNISRCAFDKLDVSKFKSLAKLEAATNTIREIDLHGLKELVYFDGSSNLIEVIKFSNGLKEIHVPRNFIKELNLPNELSIIDASHNNISVIRHFPQFLIEVALANNKLVNLPILPNSLRKLHVQNNKLKHLTRLPFNLDELDISNNDVLNIPDTRHVRTLNMEGNPCATETNANGIDLASFWEDDAKINECKTLVLHNQQRQQPMHETHTTKGRFDIKTFSHEPTPVQHHTPIHVRAYRRAHKSNPNYIPLPRKIVV